MLLLLGHGQVDLVRILVLLNHVGALVQLAQQIHRWLLVLARWRAAKLLRLPLLVEGCGRIGSVILLWLVVAGGKVGRLVGARRRVEGNHLAGVVGLVRSRAIVEVTRLEAANLGLAGAEGRLEQLARPLLDGAKVGLILAGRGELTVLLLLGGRLLRNNGWAADSCLLLLEGLPLWPLAVRLANEPVRRRCRYISTRRRTGRAGAERDREGGGRGGKQKGQLVG